MDIRVCDEFEQGFGWVVEEFRRRCSHALVVDGGVWIVDPIEAPGVDERIAALGEPRGVIQLLDRHNRGCAAFAARFGVPHLTVPDAIAGAPLTMMPIVRRRFWRESALWWPDGRVLVCADALGTAPYYPAPGESLAVYPWLRLTPPRSLAGLNPLHVLCGHGEGIHGEDAGAALEAALAGARRRAPQAFAAGLVALVRGRRQ